MINFIHVVIISSMRQNHYYFQQWCTFNFADKNLFNAEESIFFSSLTDHCSLSVCWEILKQNPLRNCCPLVIYDSEKTHVVTTSKPRLIDKGLANPRTLYPIPNFTTEKKWFRFQLRISKPFQLKLSRWCLWSFAIDLNFSIFYCSPQICDWNGSKGLGNGREPPSPFLYVGGHELLLHIFCKRNAFFLTISRWALKEGGY